jgi:outer membrane immunogenic protein
MITLARPVLAVAVVGAAGLAWTATALAADIPVKAPPAVAPVASWTGFYLGGNVGLSVGRDPTLASFTGPGAIFVPAREQFHVSPFGVVGGGQIGYNLQMAPNWVVGVEADFQGSGQTDSDNCVLNPCLPGQTIETLTQKIHWFGTVRGRTGWTNGPALFYVTGGWAYGRVTADLLLLGLGAPPPFAAVSVTDTKSGWTVGGGIEAQIIGNWTGKIEYLYMDLGSMSGSALGTGGFIAPGSTWAFSTHIRDHIVRAGVNYKFGDPVYRAAVPAGGVYKAPPAVVAYNWSGFYLGANVGLSVGRDPTSTTFLDFHEEFHLSPIGVVGGGQIGYNWQVATNWVVGVEADFQGTGQRESSTCVFICTPPNPTTVFEREFFGQKLPWFGTVRGRAGWTSGPTLYYATGGFAYGRVETDLDFLQISTAPAFAGTKSAVRSFGQNQSGWTAGAGVETQLFGNWTGKLEYLYVDLGTVEGVATTVGTGALPGGETIVFSSRIRDHVVRAGVNYKLGGPVIAKY